MPACQDGVRTDSGAVSEAHCTGRRALGFRFLSTPLGPRPGIISVSYRGLLRGQDSISSDAGWVGSLGTQPGGENPWS